MGEYQYRLPEGVVPIHYDLELHPDLNGTTFCGKVSILIETSEPRSNFLVHAKFLNISSTKIVLDGKEEEELKIKTSFEHEEFEYWVTQLDAPTPPGSYKLIFEFTGLLDNGIVGFYKSKYSNEDGSTSVMVSSKFQPTYARRAFPCFDEPSFKSTFSLILKVPSDESYIALSNMPIRETKAISSSFNLVSFEKSSPMVTYLLAFIICQYEFTEKITKSFNNKIRVYGTKRQISKLDYALKVGSTITDYYQSYFRIKYPLPKLDMAAIPDYPSGATEHWGIITYRETALIYDPHTDSEDNKERVASVIAHELAHQWFGNLVTVKWWNDLWLNEGFASYIQFKGLKSYETDWDTDSKFLVDTLHGVLDLDATAGSHPIVMEVTTPDQITAIFDAISYSKGSSVIRMLESFMGELDFRRGIISFLKDYSFKTAVTQNLFDKLEEASSSKLNITKIMNTWTKQKGYPVINLRKTSSGYIATQSRFLKNPQVSDSDTSPYNYKWSVPLSYSTTGGRRNLVWMEPEESEVEIYVRSQHTKFNVNQTGYYRVNYPEEDWIKFTVLLIKNIDALSVSDKTGLLNDAFSLSRGGLLNYSIPLNLSIIISDEIALSPWIVVLKELKFLNKVFNENEETMVKLKRYQETLVDQPVLRLGWTNVGSHDKKQLRKLVLSHACSIGIPSALTKAKKIFLNWKNHGVEIPADLRPLVFTYGIKQTPEAWDWLLETYKLETDAQKKVPLLRGLASSEDPKILEKFLKISENETVVRHQDYFTALGFVAMNPFGSSLVWDYLRANWTKLVDRFSLNDRVFGRFIVAATSHFSSEKRLNEMELFFKKYPKAGAGENSRKIALESVKNRMFFIKNFSKDIDEWLRKHFS